MKDEDIKARTDATTGAANYGVFPRRPAFSSHFRCKAEMLVTMLRYNIVDGVGPVLQIAEGWTANLPDEVHDTIDVRTDRTGPRPRPAPRLTGEGAFKDVYSDGELGRESRRDGVRSCGRRPDHAGQHVTASR